MTSTRTPSGATASRNAVALVFALNGFCFATLASRVPDLRESLDLSNGALGTLLLCIAVGSMGGMPASGHLIERWGAGAVVRLGALLDLAGLVVAGAMATLGSAPLAAVGLLAYGFGSGVWDVAMNVDGAAVERELGRSIMPRFHAGWSLGMFTGAGIGAAAAGLGVPLAAHYAVVPALAVTVAVVASRRLLPAGADEEEAVASTGGSAWLEPRTLAIGLMVLAFALAEGAANDWLALALIDGYDARHWVGVLGFALFVAAMTLGRLGGPIALDRFGRAPSLLTSAAAATAGVLVVVFTGVAALAVVGIVLWGLGAALGFPVGMSAAGDDPARTARRVSVISTIGYGAFLAGPPLLGFVGDHVGTLRSLLVIAVVMVPGAALVSSVRRPRSRTVG
ncbi:MAG TPA: MFS transporter [Nocardioides sp.]|uniref:MFS transporter n=1 Tax=Nocardioides sp. TaxID=35761 RepID=UPI002F3FF7CE